MIRRRIAEEASEAANQRPGSVGSNNHRPETPGSVRPASRASIMTDQDLKKDPDMTEIMDQMEHKFYPEDEYD